MPLRIKIEVNIRVCRLTNIDTVIQAPTLNRIPYEREKKAKIDVVGSNLFCFCNIQML